jgi:hypothetical protein
MQKVVSFYEKLPRGPAPAEKSSGLFSWYKNKYFKRGNESAARTYTAMPTAWDTTDMGYSTRSLDCFLHDHWLCSELLLPPA